LTFDDQTIENLNKVSKCSTIDGVIISNEELDALKEAANAQADAPEEDMVKPAGLEEEMAAMNLNEKKKQINSNLDHMKN